jgi:hypothetical protein
LTIAVELLTIAVELLTIAIAVSILPLSMIFPLDCGTVPTVFFFSFHFQSVFLKTLIDVCTCYFSVPMVLTTSSFSLF